MELGDIARMISRHDRLILLFVAVAVGLAALTHIGDSATYTASTRLVLDTQDPESVAGSVAIADTAKAIATSPSQVRAALDEGGVIGRDAEAIARDHVSVRGLGSSGIVQLSVTDAKSATAARIANALAAKVIQTRLTHTRGATLQIRAFDRRLARLSQRISGLDATIAALTVRAARNPLDNLTRSRLNGAERTRDFLAQQRSIVESQRVNLQTEQALRSEPSIISHATPPKKADSSRWFSDMLLAVIIGLIGGIGTAGIIETVRRTTTGGADLARAFDAPLIGSIRSNRGEGRGRASAADPGLAVRLVFAADAAGVTDVMLFPAGRSIDTEALAAQLRLGSAAGTAHGPRVAIRPFGAPSSKAQDSTGLVVVSPPTLSKAELDQSVQLVKATSLPLLGLIAEEEIPEPPEPQDGTVLNTLESRSGA